MIQNTVAFASALFLLVSFGFLSYVVSAPLVIGFTGVMVLYLIFVYFFIRTRVEIKKNDFLLLFLLALLYLYADFPLFPYSESGVNIVFLIVITFILFLPLLVKFKIFGFMQLLVAFSSIATVLVFILLSFGIEIPHLQFGDGRRYYMLFLGMSVLSTNFWDFGNIVFFRTNGLLKEPGHFAILCALLLGADKFRFSKFRNKAILLGGLFSFSAVFYISLIAGLIVFNLGKRFYKYGLASMGFLLFTLYLIFTFVPEEVQNRLFHSDENRYSSSESMLDSRAKGEINSIILEADITTLIFGNGRGFFREQEEGTSDFRISIILYGIFGLLILISVYAFLILRHKNNQLIIYFTFIFLLIFAHRAQFVYNPMTVFIFYISYYIHQINLIRSEGVINARS